MYDQGTTSLNNLPSDNVYEPNANIVMETTNIQNQQQMQPTKSPTDATTNATETDATTNATATDATTNATATAKITLLCIQDQLPKLDRHQH